jgi:hypothetical protein
VVLIVFNRPATTRRVFDAIRLARPGVLLVVADGQRPCHPDDTEKCAAVRAIVENIDWPCEVERNYAETNMGCACRVASGINWVFERVEEAIILEDDCVPHPSFFGFCEVLLDRYRHDTRIMHIGGANFQNGNRRGPYSYFFSRYAHVWGWATWPRLKAKDDLSNLFDTEDELHYWTNIYDEMTGDSPIDTWDYSWSYACRLNGVSICPNVNLIGNIGFGPEATHTKAPNCAPAMAVFDIGQITHPPWVIRNVEADKYTFYNHYGGHVIRNKCRFRNRLRTLARQALRRFEMRR